MFRESTVSLCTFQENRAKNGGREGGRRDKSLRKRGKNLGSFRCNLFFLNIWMLGRRDKHNGIGAEMNFKRGFDPGFEVIEIKGVVKRGRK